MARREGQLALAEGLDLAVGDVDEGLKAAGEYGAVGVHAADLEHQRGGLHRAVGLAALDVGGAGLGGDVAIARAVDDHLGEHGFAAGFALEDDAAQRVALHDDVGGEGVEAQADARLLEQLQVDGLEALGVDGLAQFGMVGVGGAVEHFLIEAAAGVARPVAHQADGGDAAHVARLLHQQRRRAHAARPDRRADARRACAQHQHVDLRRDGDGSCRFRVCHHAFWPPWMRI